MTKKRKIKQTAQNRSLFIFLVKYHISGRSMFCKHPEAQKENKTIRYRFCPIQFHVPCYSTHSVKKIPVVRLSNDASIGARMCFFYCSKV